MSKPERCPCMPQPYLPTRRHFLQSATMGATMGATVSATVSAKTPLGLLAPTELPSPAKAGGGIVEPGRGFQMDFWCLPRVQFWSFNNQDPVLHALGLSFSVQITTAGPDENTLSLQAGSLQTTGNTESATVRATALTTAGQQQVVAGTCEVRLKRRGQAVGVSMTASVNKEPVRAIKLILHGLPAGRVGFTSWESVENLAPVPVESLALSYPSYQGGAPVWFLAVDGEHGISFSSLDVSPRPRRFVAAPAENGSTRLELVMEEDARHWTNSFTTPEWEIRHNTTLDEAIAARTQLLETEAGMRPWDRRTDVPDWVRSLGLVVCLHGMHWSGYIFQDYAAMRASVEWVTARIPGKHVLFFVAGWEGRYYRCYGNSVPHPRMGGDAGFRALVASIHRSGAHIMPMYAGNAAMPGTPGFASYAPDSHFHADGNLGWTPMRGYTTDWMTVRGSDTEGSAWLNPGAPGWGGHLTDQVRATVRDFGVDGAFFDTQPSTENDRVHQPMEGLRTIVGNLREEHPNLMIATESWLDTSFAFLHAGQTPAAYKNWSSRYGRRWAHLAMGEPSRGSSGVHELGICEYNFEQVMTLFDWPTLALVDTTLQDAPGKAERVIDYAKGGLPRS